MDKSTGVSQATSAASGRKGVWSAMLILCVAGLLVSLELAHIHYKVNTQADFHSFCGGGTTFNCDNVARTPYSVLLGVPTAWWGIFGYLLGAGVTLAGLRNRRAGLPAACSLLLFTGFAALSASLGAISAFRLRAVCVLCAVTYGINLLLFILALLQAAAVGLAAIIAAPGSVLRARPGRTALVLILLAAATVALIALAPRYWKGGGSRHGWMALAGLARGQTPDGGHWIGAQNPTVTITEFSDYECPGCRQAHAQLRDMVAQFPDRVRIVHRHFPLDQSCNRSIERPFHENACRLALMAECAGRAGRFWEANDYLFRHSGSLETSASETVATDLKLDPAPFERCMQGEGLPDVKNDIEMGIALNLRGTPSFLVDGQVYFGNLPASVLERLRGTAGK